MFAFLRHEQTRNHLSLMDANPAEQGGLRMDNFLCLLPSGREETLRSASGRPAGGKSRMHALRIIEK
jgi:hypothetical protein